MSRQLSLSAAFSIFAMGLFALSSANSEPAEFQATDASANSVGLALPGYVKTADLSGLPFFRD